MQSPTLTSTTEMRRVQQNAPRLRGAIALAISSFIVGCLAVITVHYSLILPAMLEARQLQLNATMEQRAALLNGLATERARLALVLAGIGEEMYRERIAEQSWQAESWWESRFENHLRAQLGSFPAVVGGGIWYEPNTFNRDLRHRGYYVQWLPPVGKRRKLDFTMEWSDPKHDYHSQGWYTTLLPPDHPRSSALPSRVAWTSPYQDPVTGVMMITVDAAMYDSTGRIIGMSTVDWNLDQIAELVHQTKPTPSSQTFIVDPRSQLFVALTGSDRAPMSPTSVVPWGKGINLSASTATFSSVTVRLPHDNDETHVLSQALQSGLILGFTIPNEDIIGPANRGARMILVTLLAIVTLSLIAIASIAKRLIRAHTAELAIAHDRAVENARLQGQFLANVSHEIRTPMNGVLGMLELALDQPLDKGPKELIGLAHQSARNLLRVINDVLDISKLQAGKVSFVREVFSPREVVNDVQRLLEISARERELEIVTYVGADVPQAIVGDSGRTSQILTNLIGNAIKFSVSKGGIAVIVERDPHDAGSLLLCVSDTGPGIPAERISYIFEAFTQIGDSTARHPGGSGLGLAIVKSLVEGLGGSIEVRSRESVGSAFIVRLPLITPKEAASATPSPAASLPGKANSTRSLRILVAEDNPINQQLIERILRREGHDVLVAGNGELALSSFTEGDFDLVILDLQMPVLDGLGTLRKIRNLDRRRGKVPVIALTAHALPEQRDEMLREGFDAYVTKPLNRIELFYELQRLTNRRGT